MASGIQTIANEGVHMEPYFVEFIDDSAGNRVYTHPAVGIRVLDRQAALTTIDVLKGVLTSGTARAELADYASRNPAFGKTGTQEKNWTAFFVGATPYLSTAVLVRDPDRYTPMANIPEFSAAGVQRVQGGTFPARIWGAFMEEVGLERLGLDLDWAPPGPPARPPARLVLPGNECVFRWSVSSRPRRRPTRPGRTATVVADDGADGFRRPAAAPDSTTTTTTDAADTTPDTTTTTRPPRPIYAPVESGTTIAPNVLDPTAPLPSVPLDRLVRPC